MYAMVKPHNIRDMTNEIEQAKMRLKVSMLRSVTLPLSSMLSATGDSASGPSEPKKRGSTSWMKHSIKAQGMN